MKPISTPSRTLFFSGLVFLLLLSSCKYDTAAEFNIEETQQADREQIREMLERSKTYIEQDRLSDAIATLDSIIQQYGTYDEVEDAYLLKEDAERSYVLEKIRTQTDLDSLYAYMEDYDQKEIRDTAKERVGEMVNTTEDKELLGDFLDSNKLPEYRTTAKQRQKELADKQKAERLADAQQANDAETWNKFLRDYEDHPDRKAIEDKIIGLEVDDVFAGQFEEIPKAQLTGDVNYVQSTVEIKNDTPYTLTVLYSGPENKRMNIASGRTLTATMKSGNYRVIASVSSARVTNYAGTETMQGEYSSSFYIGN